MRTSKQPSLHDISAVFQLIGECRELWADSHAWQHHLVREACRLTGTRVGTFSHSWLSPDRTRTEIYDEIDDGWRDDDARSHRVRLLANHPDRVAFFPRLYALAAQAIDTNQTVTRLREEMRTDDDWYASSIFNDYHRPAYIDNSIMSFACNRQTGNLVFLQFWQDITDPIPTQRCKAIVTLLNEQLAPLVGTTLATQSQRGLSGLSPRLRQTLRALLAGDSEKQLAARLHLSRPTAHEYIGAVYRHFAVTSRAELMSYFIHRSPKPRSGAPSTSRLLH